MLLGSFDPALTRDTACTEPKLGPDKSYFLFEVKWLRKVSEPLGPCNNVSMMPMIQSMFFKQQKCSCSPDEKQGQDKHVSRIQETPPPFELAYRAHSVELCIQKTQQTGDDTCQYMIVIKGCCTHNSTLNINWIANDGLTYLCTCKRKHGGIR